MGMASNIIKSFDTCKFDGKIEEKGGPIPDDDVLDNIRASAKIKAPVFNERKEREGSFIFVAGGPTLKGYVKELKKRYKNGDVICTSNNTHDFLIKNGIIPTYTIVMDPKKIVAEYIKKPRKGVKYFIATCCNPKVAGGLLKKKMDVTKLCIGYGIQDESDLDVQKELYPEIKYTHYLVGGTMTGLRAMCFATLLGYRKIEYYGFDSCFPANYKFIPSTDKRYKTVLKRNMNFYYRDTEKNIKYTMDFIKGGFFYAYPKKRAEGVIVVETSDGRKFLTSNCFAHQCKQFMKWVERYEGVLDITVHGDNLSSHILKLHKECLERLEKKVGTRRWTKSYKKLQKKFHKTKKYGRWGDHDSEIVARAILAMYYRVGRTVTLLDYGCGYASLAKELNKIINIVDITNYDPFIDKYSKVPKGKFDIVTSFDVMEHVELQCVRNTIDFISSKAKYMVLMSISITDAAKTLPDGRNAHITIKTANWWASHLNKKMVLKESFVPKDKSSVYFILQPYDANKLMEKENGNNGADKKANKTKKDRVFKVLRINR